MFLAQVAFGLWHAILESSLTFKTAKEIEITAFLGVLFSLLQSLGSYRCSPKPPLKEQRQTFKVTQVGTEVTEVTAMQQ